MCYKHIIGTKLRKISHKASLLPLFFAYACTIKAIIDRPCKGLLLFRNDKNCPFHRYFSFMHIGFMNVCRIYNNPFCRKDSSFSAHSPTIEPLFAYHRTLIRLLPNPCSSVIEPLFDCPRMLVRCSSNKYSVANG